MYEFWYNYIKPKYGDNARLCCMDTHSFIIYIQTEYLYKDIANDVNKWFDASGYDKNHNRPLEMGINKKVPGMFKDELERKIMTEFVAHRARAYAFRTEKGIEQKKAKGTKKCVVKKDITFENYKEAPFSSKTIIKSHQAFKSDHHNVCTKEYNKTALSNNDDKRLQTFDGITTYPIGTNAFNVCESEILARRKVIPIKLY